MFTIWSFLLIQIIIQLWNNVLFLEGIINIEKRSKYLKTCIFFKFEIVSHELQILLKIWSSQGVYQNVELYMVYTVILLALIYVRVTSEKKKKKKSGVCDVFWARTEEVDWDTGLEEKFKFLIVPKEIQRNVQTTESNK